MKKTKWLFLPVLILAASILLTISAGAADNGLLALTAAEGAIGETVTVDLIISKNPGLLTLKVAVSYDEDLDLVSVEDLALIAGYVTPSPTIASPYTLFWKDSLSTQNNIECGAIARLTFKIKDDAELGEKRISVKFTESRNADGATNAFDSAEATVKVIEKKSVIKCAQIALGTDISVNFYADVIAADEGARMRFTMNGKETIVDGTPDEFGLYVFPFTGITPQCMGDIIKVELVKDTKVLDVKDDYSVLQNCKILLGKTAADLGLTNDQYAAMQTLIADLMDYGAAAQVYRGYKTDSLVNEDGDIAALTPTEFTPWKGEDADAVSSYLDDAQNENVYIYAAGIYFDYCNRMYIKFHAEGIDLTKFCVTTSAEPDNQYLLNDEKHPILQLDDQDNYIVLFDAVPAYELGNDEVFYEIALNTFTMKGTKRILKSVHGLFYSIPAYVYSKQEETTPMSDLAKALYKYGHSAAVYAAIVK